MRLSMDPEDVRELNESIQLLTASIRSFADASGVATGSLASLERAGVALTAAERAELLAKEKMTTAANNFKSAVDNAGTAMTSFAKAAVSAEEGFKKYGAAMNSAGDAAFDIGKNFGILGMAIGGLLKGIGMFAGEALKIHDTMIQMNREATKFAGILPTTNRQVADLAANAGYAGDKMLKLVKIAEGVGTNLVALGGTAGSGVIRFEKLANVGNKVYEQFSKLGVSQESLTKMQADYVRMQGISGQAYNMQNKSMGQLQKESLAYAENLIKMSAITGEQADELQKQREVVKSEREERIKVIQENEMIRRLDADGRTEEANEIRNQQRTRSAMLQKATDTLGPEMASMMGRVLRTGAFDDFSSGLAAAGFTVEDLQGQMKQMASEVGKTNDLKKQEAILTAGSNKVMQQGEDQIKDFAVRMGDAAQFAGKELFDAFGVTDSVMGKMITRGETLTEADKQAQAELEAKKAAADKDAAMRAAQETAERELQKTYQTQMLTLANMIIPAVIDGLNFFNEVMNGVTAAVNMVIDAYNFLAPIINVAMDALTQIIDFALWPLLEVGGFLTSNWETIVKVSKDVTDIFLVPFLWAGSKLVDLFDKTIVPVMEWFGEKFKQLGEAVGGLFEKIGGWLGMDTGEGTGFLDWLGNLADSARGVNKESTQNISKSEYAGIVRDAWGGIASGASGIADLAERRSQYRAGQIGEAAGISGDAVREIGRLAVGGVAGGAMGLRAAGTAARVLKMERGASAAMALKSAAVGGTIGGMMTSGGELGQLGNVSAVNYTTDPEEARKATEEALAATVEQTRNVQASTNETIKDTTQKIENIEQNKKLAKENKEQSEEKTKLFKTFGDAIKSVTTNLGTLKQSIDDMVTQIGTSIMALQQMSPVGPGGTSQILETIKKRESGGNYQAQAKGSSASGAYQFTDSTWQSLTKKYKIGEIYKSAKDAPPAIQDAVAAKYVDEILQEAGGDVSKVPLKWYTGNIQGNISASAIAANNGLTPQMYQQKWMTDYNRMGAEMANRLGSGDIVSLGRQLQSQGFMVSENPAFGGVTPGVHKGAGHDEGRAIDINAINGDDSKDPVAAAKMDALAQQLSGNPNLTVLWRTKGHYNHMHVETKKVSAARGGVFSGSSGGYPATLHGTELVSPISVDSILMKLAKTSISDPAAQEITKNIASTTSTDDSANRRANLGSEMLGVLAAKMDQLIDAIENGNDTRQKLLQYSQT